MNASGSLLFDLWADLQQPQVLWQVAVLLACLGVAWLADRGVRAHRERAGTAGSRVLHVGQRGLQRLTFPLVALVLVWLMRPLLAHWHNVNLLSLAVPLLTSLAAIRMVFFALRQGMGDAHWMVSFEKVFAACVWGVVALHLTGLLPELIALLDGVVFPLGKERLTLWLLLQGAGALLAGLLGALWLGGLAEARLMAAEGLDGNLRVVFARLSRALLLVLAVLIGLPLVGIDLTMLSVFGGALGVGLGFGLQKIAANYVSGFIILLDRSIRIGNVIAVGSERGEVTRITTRYTVLKARNGLEMIVPNEMLVSSVIANETFSETQVRIPIKVQVAYGSDLERVQRLLIDAALAQPRVLREPEPRAHVMLFADSGIDMELRFWIADPEAGTGQIKSDIHLAIWKAFRAEGIEIPFPQREVRLLS
ncbi:MAG: mechanosensitive ion channel domain-containing protein [Pseudomonadota bacterium]